MSATLEAREPVARYLASPPLLQHFDRVAQAPGGIARLRELILTLAVQGKLVPQDPTDEPASVLLERIRSEKALLVKNGKIRKSKSLPEISEEDIFELPITWKWARLGDLGDWGAGATPSRSNGEYYGGDIPWFKSGELTADLISDAEEHVTPLALKECSLRENRAGDVLIAMYGATIGKASILSRPATTNQAVCACTPYSGLNNRYLLLLLKALKPYFVSIGAGGAQPNISREKIIATVVALPPLAEQSRIVARVDELMALCDTLEETGRLAAVQHERLASALFDALANSATAEEATENWQRIAPHFDLLLDQTSTVDRLEQTILQLAVRGRLVPQNPTDEPASALLQKIRNKKNRLIATGQLKREKHLPPIRDEEQPSELPEGWDVVSFPELCVIGGGATPSKAKPMYWEGDLPWVSPKDMKVDFISDAQDHVSKLALEETRLPLIPKSSLLIVVRGMILAHSFPVGVTQVEVTINQDMKSLTPLYPELTPYLALVCKGFKQEILNLVERSSHGTCKLESDKLFAFRFGLPPLAEQSRIVARVAELRALCAQLRERLAATTQTQSRLAETLIETVVV
ncbi:restriction endonuclease subunit S [Azonexus fungiphilus]|uniref:restriction endonuclease subunit S n=1 Tax=Azonexus fungiphilus TaxID=146940 RepID=UPI00156A981E|nr:restriction endonuclease subunit S [Azonexus fungiphilus]NHC06877.1 restriction endonuclease subunit S [Azonexus fungiphilus]